MSYRRDEVALAFANDNARKFGRGAILGIAITTSNWLRLESLGAQDNVPMTGSGNQQTFVPLGPALDFFDFFSIKEIITPIPFEGPIPTTGG